MSDRKYNRGTSQQMRMGSAASYRRAMRARELRRKRRRRRRNLLIGGLGAVMLIFVLIFTGFAGGGTPDVVAPETTVTSDATQFIPGETSPEPAPTDAPTPEPTVEVVSDYAALRPQAREGCLPVFKSIDTQDKVIAITVDDCFQASNLRAIIDLAISNNAKLTFFPIGEQALKEPQQAALKYAWENGMELENHTFTHNGLYGCDDEELAAEIYKQNLVLSKLLGVEYQCHFLRPKGGDAKNDQRIHAYISQLGYYGVAHWSQSGNRSVEKLINSLAPGQVYLFHTTDKDLERLKVFIPYAVEQGYRLVTLNELFGYSENSYTALEKPIEEHEIPPLEPYEKVAVSYGVGSYAYGVKLLQERLVELNYLSGNADGVFGKNTAKAVAMFQKVSGMTITGTADLDTQTRLFAEDAAANTGQPI